MMQPKPTSLSTIDPTSNAPEGVVRVRCAIVPFCKPRSVAPSLECRNQHWFLDLQDAAIKINTWRQDYNQVRPHGSIDNRVPMDLLKPTGFLTF